MIGTWRWNVGMGLAGSVLTLLFSIGKNPLDVMLIRSVYAFIAFAVLAFILRAAFAFILRPPAIEAVPEGAETAGEKGSTLDLITPDESEDINNLLKTQLEEGARPVKQQTEVDAKPVEDAESSFRPLNPPQLVTAPTKDPEQLAQAIRHLTGG
ncbi:hypothetical protein [Paenibacillus sp. NEAU-GSW1]|uniref:hypothetical protein n=1 Tax=Paenibacillus sp. NEAU-GSW1 TaxID=2682486 RepID=UPI0012E14531|nr:hypothetical protein [Paenibacillus sp. NEAU-GSW1]MUT66378.1 hypothetical protein [Paenibacillus sp. NEAU-GSW1]